MARIKPDPNEPLGAAEVARLLAVSRDTVRQWRYRRVFPEPDWPEVNMHPAWKRSTVVGWAVAGGRLGRGHSVEPSELVEAEAS